MIEVNGKQYPMWSQFVERKKEWIGGKLTDYGDSMDKSMGFKTMETEITDITLEPNGKESAMFSVVGKEFTCGSDVGYVGIGGNQPKEGLMFSGYGGHEWKITKPVSVAKTGD